MPTDCDQELAAGHGDGRGAKGGDLDGAETRRDEGEEGFIAQSDGLAGAPAGQDRCGQGARGRARGRAALDRLPVRPLPVAAVVTDVASGTLLSLEDRVHPKVQELQIGESVESS